MRRLVRADRAPLVLVLACLGILAAGSTALAQQPRAEPWPEGEPPPVEGLDGAHWYRAELGWIVVDDPSFAPRAASEMLAAAEAYERHFGEAAPDGAVVSLAFAGRTEKLERAGAEWVLAYPFARVAERAERGVDAGADGGPAVEEQAAEIRAKIEARLEARGIRKSDQEIDAMVERALSSSGGDDAGAGARPDLRKALRHEIGHDLFEARWPSSGEEDGSYGTPAPDWLDETAAVLMEGPRMTASRRSVFRRAVKKRETIPLAEFFRMEHPLHGSAALQAARDSAGEKGAVVLSGDEIDVRLGRLKYFYAQARGIADFLAEKSGRATLVAEIARSLRGGSDMGDWLRRHGPEHGLPTTVPALEEAFLRWARSDPYGGRS